MMMMMRFSNTFHTFKEPRFPFQFENSQSQSLPLTSSPRTLFCHCISSKAFLPTSLCKRFKLIQIFKALTTGCDVFLHLTAVKLEV